LKTLAPVRPMLAKLIPRLGSNHDGERLATVDAIKRTLGSAGCDWHDFAASIGLNAERPAPKNKFEDAEPAAYWMFLFCHERQAWLNVLHQAWCVSDWEKKFVADLRIKAVRFSSYEVSERQEQVLDRIVFKASRRGVRP
jgi:hypothetical protein